MQTYRQTVVDDYQGGFLWLGISVDKTSKNSFLQ